MSVLIAIMLCRKELATPLWARARQAGAYTDTERRNFGIADDIYAAGLLLAYMAFIPFCKPGSIDGPSLQRCAAVAAVSAAHDACLLEISFLFSNSFSKSFSLAIDDLLLRIMQLPSAATKV